MQILDAKLITERLSTRSARLTNPNAETLKITATLTDMYPADLADVNLEISLALYRINDFGHAEFCGAYNWHGGNGVPAPQIEWPGAARRVFLIIDPSRDVTAGASI